MTDSRVEIMNAFTPNREVDEPASFAGRKDAVLDLTDALIAEGSCPIIYGERGLGKSSLALQVARIALGDDELLREFRAESRALAGDRAFIPFWVTCTKGVKDKDLLLQRIINTAETLETLEAVSKKRLIKQTDTHKLKLSVYEGETKQEFESVAGRSFSELDIEEKLLKVLDRVLENGAPGVLIIIDELDRMEDTEGLADFLKSASSNKVKFLLVGVGQSISTLLHDHESLDRLLHPVYVSVMGQGELKEIVGKVLSSLRRKHLTFEFPSTRSTGSSRRLAGFHILFIVWDKRPCSARTMPGSVLCP